MSTAFRPSKAEAFRPNRAEAYLDIETTGLHPGYCQITVVGIYHVRRFQSWLVQLVGDNITRDNLLKALNGADTLHTYNGSRFDLPFIDARCKVNLEEQFKHIDLMYECWHSDLFGGLKSVERQLGIHRNLTEVDGLEAVRLWRRYKNHSDQDALKTLLEYNKEDVVNLKALKEKLL